MRTVHGKFLRKARRDLGPIRRLAITAAGAISLFATPAQALVIVPVFDSSITSLANAAVVEAAFNTAADKFEAAFANPVTVRIAVSWGSVAGSPIPVGDVGSSRTNISGGWAYSDVTGMLQAAAAAHPSDRWLTTAAAHLSVIDPTRTDNFGVPYAEAQALGLLPANLATIAGSIGFRSGTNFDFNPVGGIGAGSYDFQGLAAHEIDEVLGRITGLQAGATQFALPFDLFRYTASGVTSFSYSAHAYYSIDGGRSNLGYFNYSGSGDRSDWLTLAGSTDIQNAYLSAGKAFNVSATDLTILSALGWGGAAASRYGGSPTGAWSTFGAAGAPEPTAWMLAFTGLALVGIAARRRRAMLPTR